LKGGKKLKVKNILIIFTAIIVLTTICQGEFTSLANNYSGNIGFEQVSDSIISVRQPAEFEQMEAVLIRYPFGIPYDLIAEMSEDVEVITIVDTVAHQNDILDEFENNDVDLDNCSFMIAPSNSYWTRDYGPWFVFSETEMELKVVDFEYNRPRIHDNNIPNVFSDHQGLNYTYMDLIQTGGNYMTDGNGIAISTDLVVEENPGKTLQDIQQIMHQYLGITNYHLPSDVNGEYIKHIDCWAKYLSPETILIREVPETHPQYQEIEAAVDYFETQISCYNTNYTIVRVYTPNNEPYTNSLILNDKVLIPMEGTQWDDDAIQTYEQAMPGYEIIGFTAIDEPWLSTDAIHCRIKGVPDRDMLYLDHFPLQGDNGFTVRTKVIPFSGENVKDINLYWRIEGETWSNIPMNPLQDSWFESYIPLQDYEENVVYYIDAEDNAGNRATHPIPGEADPHVFTVTNLPPTIPAIDGQTEVKVETEYEYTFTSSDPEENMVSYYIDWGDGNITTWTDFESSDSTYTATHSWKNQDEITIKAKSKDTHGAESEYEIIQVTLSKQKDFYDTLIQFIHQLIHLFPFLKIILV